jgi:mRNA-degrading endonuclease toxin of MazEF toxin-antitoxin module
VPTLGRGRIILARILDPQGQNPKDKPLVVLTADHEIRDDAPFVAVAITSTIPLHVPDNFVELPFHPAGTVATGLRRASAAICSWLQKLTAKDVIKDIGRVPDKQMLQILSKVKELGRSSP